MNTICAREWLRPEDTVNIDTFSVDTIEGLTVNLQQGQLSLVKSSGKAEKLEVLGLFHGEVPDGHGIGVPENERNGEIRVAVAAQA